MPSSIVPARRARSFGVISPGVQDILLTVNLTPRMCLGFKTPFQAILAELGKDFKSASHETVALRSGIQGTHAER